MAILRMQEIRKLNSEQRQSRLLQYRKELMDLKSQLSAGGSIDNPGRIKAIKQTIARLMTVENELSEKS